jgi:RNA polymerase sigma-70 factor (ECF subfamily)
MSRFDTTRWSLVVRARGGAADARTALAVLCATYRPPVLAYIRSRGYGSDAAQDLTQAFFARFLEQAIHAAADPARGRFRAFLLTAIKRFLINAEEEAHAVKRGGRIHFESIDAVANGTASILPADEETPERAFERAWAVVVIEAALRRLRDEADAAGKRELFDQLRDFLTEAPDETDYARVAAALNLRRNTLAVAVHRMRHRLRELVREELQQTATDRPALETELRELRGAFGSVLQAAAD